MVPVTFPRKKVDRVCSTATEGQVETELTGFDMILSVSTLFSAEKKLTTKTEEADN
jgi:hypothetical protein